MLRRMVLTTAVIALTASPVIAQPSYSDVFFFGTSELDTGNWLLNPTLAAHPLAPTAAKGFYDGRWQSGPAWSDYLAVALGHDATASLAGGQNFAYGVGWLGPLPTVADGPWSGLAADLAPNTDLYFGSQVSAALVRYPTLPSDALYVISIGSNDVDFFGRTLSDADDVANAALFHIKRLVAAGATSFLIKTLGGDPLVPSFNVNYTQTLLDGLADVPGITVSVLDIRTFNQTVVQAPGFLAGLGITSFGQCLGIANQPDTPCETAAIAETTNGRPYLGSSYFTFDGLHRDPKVNEALAQYALAQLPVTVPEPGTISLLAIGLVGAGLAGRRRRRSSAAS